MAESWKLPRRAWQRLALTGGILALNLVLILTIGVTRPDQAVSGQRQQRATNVRSTPAKPRPYQQVPPAAPAAPADDPKTSDQAALQRWASRMADATGLAASAVTAYGRAQMWMRYEYPDCHLPWASLAAIDQLGAAPRQQPRDVARALCGQHVDMRTPKGWWTAVVDYQQSVEFAKRVFALAHRYAKATS